MPASNRRRAATTLDHGHGKAEGAGAGDDEDGNGHSDGIVQVAIEGQPEEEGGEGGQMHDGRIEFGGAVGNAAIAVAAAFGHFHQPHHLGERRILLTGLGADGEGAGKVERAGFEPCAGLGRDGHAFATDEATIQVGGAGKDDGIDGDALAGRQQDGHAGHDFAQRQIFGATVGLHDQRAARGQPGEALDRGAGALAHDMVQGAADQQEEDQRDGGVIIDLLAGMDGVVEAERKGQGDADGDRHVHIGAAVANGIPGGEVEDPAGIEHGGQGQAGADPMQDITRCAIGAGPDRARQHHDVHRGKGGHGQSADQRGQGRVLAVVLALIEMRLVADIDQGLDHGGRRAIAEPADGDALGGKVDACRLHALEPAKRLFDSLDAGAAMDGRHG